MGTTKYNGAYKGEVIASLKQAMSGLKSCKSVSIDIPSDFEAAGTLRNALDTLKGIDIKGAVSEIKSASADFERAENELNNYLGNFLNIFQIGDKNESVKNTKEQLEETQRLLNRNLEKQQKATRKNKKTAWDKLLENNLKKSEKSTKIANQAIAKEQQRIQEKTRRVQASAQNTLVRIQEKIRRVQASAQNTLVATGKGLTKMGENIGDFIALRTERLQENHLRTIYTSNAEYEKAYREQYEKNIEKMRKKTMSYVAKDHTEATFNKLYEENDTLKEIDEKAYSPFKTTGVAYKIGEQVAPAIVATGAMVVAPEAAPTIVPIIIGMNSGGRASEEYLHDKKMNSKEGIEQAYKDGQITKEEYDSYKYIWNLSAEEFSIAMNGMENQTDKDRLFQTYYMSDKWTKEGNRDEAITYGNAVGAWDAAQYALGMNLFKFNSTNSALLNSSMRVGVDTGLNASDIPFKASVRSLIDQDTDFDTEFEKLGGWNAVGISAALGFAGSVLGELGMNLKASKEADQIYKMQGVDPDDIYDEIKVSLKNDIMSGKISVDDIDSEDFLINYAKSKGYSNKSIENWVTDHYDKVGKYGIDQGIYSEHTWYETASGKKLNNKKQLKKALKNNESITIKHDDYFIQQTEKLANRYKLNSDEAIQILEIMDTPGGMCSFSATSEALAYQYKDIPEMFKQKYGIDLYRETGGINEEIYVDYFINSNVYLTDGYGYGMRPDKVGALNKYYTKKQYDIPDGRTVLSDQYKVFASLYDETLFKTQSSGTLSKYLRNKGMPDEVEVKRLYFSRSTEGLENGSLEDVIDAINNGESVNMYVFPNYNKATKKFESMHIKLKNANRLLDDSYINDPHAVNVIGIKGEDVIISTWGQIWSAKLSELKEVFIEFASLVKK